jgi:hypothetical protein
MIAPELCHVLFFIPKVVVSGIIISQFPEKYPNAAD